MTITFADVSHHQEIVDLAAYQRAGHDRIVLKATEGTGFTDSSFTARWRQAGQLGLARVAYHYARNKFNGAQEFDYFWGVVQAAGGLGERDRLCLDTEDTDTQSRAAAEAREFTSRAVARGVTRGLVYTGRWYANPNHLSASVFAPGWRLLWLSHYDMSTPDSQILLPDGWSRSQLVARQYTFQATVAGIAEPCDYSRVLVDWLTTAPPPVEDDMFDDPDRAKLNELLTRVRHVEAMVPAAAGQSQARDAAQDAILAALSEQLSKVATGDVDEQALAAALAPAVGTQLAADVAARLAS